MTVDVDAKLVSVTGDPLHPVNRGATCLKPLHLPADALWQWAGDEHGIVRFDGAGARLKIGDRVEFIPPHCDPTVNLYDRIFGHRNGQLETVWPIAARGMSQ